MFSKNKFKLLGLILFLSMVIPSLTATTAVSNDSVTEEQLIDSLPMETSSKDTEKTVKSTYEDYALDVPTPTKPQPETTQDTTPRSKQASVGTLTNGTWVDGTITQNEFIAYDFELMATSDVNIYCESLKNDDWAWLDLMIDDDTGTTVAGKSGSWIYDDVELATALPSGNYTLLLFGAGSFWGEFGTVEGLMYNFTYTYEPAAGLPFNVVNMDLNSTESFTFYGDCYPGIIYGDPTYPAEFQAEWAWSDQIWLTNFTIPEPARYETGAMSVNVTATWPLGYSAYETVWLFIGPEEGFIDLDGEDITIAGAETYWTATGKQTLLTVLDPGVYTLAAVCFDDDYYGYLDCTVQLNASMYVEPEQTFTDISIGDEIGIFGDGMYAYNITLEENTTYYCAIGEPDSWIGDISWIATMGCDGDGDVKVVITNSTGSQVAFFDDSYFDMVNWASRSSAIFTVPEAGEYTVWFSYFLGAGPFDGSFQIYDVDWLTNDAPTLMEGVTNGTVIRNGTDVNVVDVFNFEVEAADAGMLHTIWIEDDLYDYVYWDLMLSDSTDLGLTGILQDCGFRGGLMYWGAVNYANNSVSMVLPEGNYCLILEAQVAGNDNTALEMDYKLHHDIYDVSVLAVGDTDIAGAVDDSTGITYFVLDVPNQDDTGVRWVAYEITVDPATADDVILQWHDADLGFIREIANAGGDGEAETIQLVIDASDLRDGGMHKVFSVQAAGSRATVANFTISFEEWTPSSSIPSDSGYLDPDVKPNAWHAVTVSSGNYWMNFTSWNRTLYGDIMPTGPQVEENGTFPDDSSPDVKLRIMGASGYPWSTDDAGLDHFTLEDGTYYILVQIGDAIIDRGICGYIDLNVSYSFTFASWLRPSAVDLDLYDTPMVEDVMDYTFEITLSSSTPYYFAFESFGDSDFDVYLYDPAGLTVVDSDLTSLGWASFIYETYLGGPYTIFVHEYYWSIGSFSFSVRPLEAIYDNESPDHICTQMFYEFDLTADNWYLESTYGDEDTDLYWGDGVWVYSPEFTVMPAGIWVLVGDSDYGFSDAGSWSFTLYKTPLKIITEIPDPVTNTVTVTADGVTDTTTITQAVQTVTETTTETSPGFGWFAIVLLAIPIFVLRRYRK